MDFPRCVSFGFKAVAAVNPPDQKVVKFIYSEKATKFCEIFPLLLTVCTVNSQNTE